MGVPASKSAIKTNFLSLLSLVSPFCWLDLENRVDVPKVVDMCVDLRDFSLIKLCKVREGSGSG